MSKMTKRVHVGFDMTVVVDTDEMYQKIVLDIAKRAGAGQKVDPKEQNILVAALTYGQEGCLETILKQAFRSFLRDAVMEANSEEMGIKMSPVRVDIRK